MVNYSTLLRSIMFVIADILAAAVVIVIYRKSAFHKHFRLLLFANCVSTWIYSAGLAFYYLSMEINHKTLEQAAGLWMYGLYSYAFSMFYMNIERIFASFFAKDYEKVGQFRFTTLPIFAITFVSSGIIIFPYIYLHTKLFDLIISSVFVIMGLFTTATSCLLLKFTRAKLIQRSRMDINLSEKYQTGENYFSSRVTVVISVNEFITWIVIAALYFTASLSSTETILFQFFSVVLDIVDAVMCEKSIVCYSTVLIFIHRRSKKKIIRIKPHCVATTADQYFEALQQQWNTKSNELLNII